MRWRGQDCSFQSSALQRVGKLQREIRGAQKIRKRSEAAAAEQEIFHDDDDHMQTEQFSEAVLGDTIAP